MQETNQTAGQTAGGGAIGDADDVIVVRDLHKSFGDLKVLRGIDLAVKRGTILALLGPNGAGKTTTVRILSTLLAPDKGTASINGHDVMESPAGARASIGLTGQFAAVDEYLTGEENLNLIGRLYHLSKAEAASRTRELIRQFDLEKPAKRPVRTYSGGMKRRLDLAMSLIASPPVLFLDEPTTGLDPSGRLTIWSMIEQLAKNGATILLTTQYMEEADRLADDIVVIDGGKIIAQGDAQSLKARVGSEHLEITMKRAQDLSRAKKVVSGAIGVGDKDLHIEQNTRVLSVATKDGVHDLRQVLQQLEDARLAVESVSLRKPTLDDVFLTLTGKGASAKDDKNTDDDKEKTDATV